MQWLDFWLVVALPETLFPLAEMSLLAFFPLKAVTLILLLPLYYVL